MKVPLKAVTHFMANHAVRGLPTGVDRALFAFYVPNRAGQGRCQPSLVGTQADGLGAIFHHVVAKFPTQFDFVHDPL